ncbi:MAG: DNA polymerase III subunit chi [Pseudomonadota bacterium]
MTRVDFYLLTDLGDDARMRFACQLCLRAMKAGTVVHIHTRDTAHANAVDELLWDYPRHRFLPHSVNDASASSPIHISDQEPSLTEGTLINLTDEVPKFFGRFDRVAEIIVGEGKASGRDRYQFYRDRGYPLHHHNLDSWEQSDALAS